MGLSIVTPHYNDLEGLQRIYACLQEQTTKEWEWVIVDDFSDAAILSSMKTWSNTISDNRIKLICNSNKTNASVCRNKGANDALYEHLIFLDADDYISTDFVENRQLKVTDFTIFKNTAMDDKYHGIKILPKKSGNYLDYFLSTQFIWPITAVLWERNFFNEIGGFHTELSRLQDVELSVRALQKSTKYNILDNDIDFYYRVKPIRERKNFVKPVCESVNLFISKLLDTSSLSNDQLALISSYYYLCTKYLVRSNSHDGISLVYRNLKLFYKKKHIHIGEYLCGCVFLKLYSWKIVTSNMFLRLNRFVFKPKNNNEVN